MMQQMTPDPARALLMAEAVMGRVVGREALTLAFNDVFRILAGLFIAALVMVPFCRPPRQAGAAPVDAH
jgi:DHA2 family multidrug resistance protein